MKNIFILLIAGLSLAACKSEDKNASGSTGTDTTATNTVPQDGTTATTDFTSIQWLDSTYVDLGKLTEGKSVELSFRFRNSGNKNLVIENVTAQCGCTIPEKPEKPIAPGEEGIIKAMFNGSGHGEIRKEVYVTANTSPDKAHTLTFRAEMVK